MTRGQEIALQQRQDFAELMKHYPFTMETLAGEEWRDIEGTNGKYQISNYGRVKSFTNKARILKPRLDNHTKGYTICCLHLNGKRKQFHVHRLVAKAFILNPDNKPQVNHIDGCTWNCCTSNLEWVTGSENVQHAFDTGLKKALKGADNPYAKLTNEQVTYIRKNPDNLNLEQLGKKFGVRFSKISEIQLGKSYQNVGGIFRKKKRENLSYESKKEIYRLYQTGDYTQTQLGEMFNVQRCALGKAIKLIERELDCVINHRFKLSKEDREKIRAEYRPNVRGCGRRVLAKKYGCAVTTILNIVNEK